MKQQLKDIADHLTLQAYNFPEVVVYNVKLAEFRVHGVTIRCRPYRQAILRVAEKYRKGPPVGCRVVNSRKGCREPIVPRMSKAKREAFAAQANADGDFLDLAVG